MSRRPPLPPGQLSLPLNLKDPALEKILAEIAESRKRLAAIKQRELLRRSRVEYEQLPN